MLCKSCSLRCCDEAKKTCLYRQCRRAPGHDRASPSVCESLGRALRCNNMHALCLCLEMGGHLQTSCHVTCNMSVFLARQSLWCYSAEASALS